MRNKAYEVTDWQDILGIIARSDTVRIAMHDEPYPYIIPLNFGEEVIDGKITLYIHTGYTGKKMDLFHRNPNVAFEMDGNHELYYRQSNMSCNFRYESIVGTGRLELVGDGEKEKALTLIMSHYHPEGVRFNPKFVSMTQCMKILVDSVTAKRCAPKEQAADYAVMPFQGDIRSPHF